MKTSAKAGSGARPDLDIESRGLAIRASSRSADGVAAMFRSAEPPIIGRVESDRFLLDLRTIEDPAAIVPTPRVRAIVGTAGHIDHGKSALVRALTGIDPDRLPEEKERGISIELGFAHLETADGDRVGIVDVPGHERFIRQMLAGAQGFDYVLVVVAADDGVMPQTEEHFEICHLLGVRRGAFVITKIDLVAPERVAEVRDEIALLGEGTAFADAPVFAVSAVTGEGVATLKAHLLDAVVGVERGASDRRAVSPSRRSRVRPQGARRDRDRHRSGRLGGAG